MTCSGNASVTVQFPGAVVPLLVSDTSTWKNVPPVFEGVAVQAIPLVPPPEEELELEELELDELLLDELEDDELEEEVELVLVVLVELPDEELELPGKGSPGHEPVALVVGQGTTVQEIVQRTVVVSSSIPLPRASSMTRLICLLGPCVQDGRDAVCQVDQPPVGTNRPPYESRYTLFSYTETTGVVVAPFA